MKPALMTPEQHERHHLCFITKRDGDRLAVEVTSRLIATNAYDLRNRVSIAIEDGVKFVAIDLAQADDVDTKGFGALLSIARATMKRGGSTTILNAQPDVLALFEYHHIASQFTFATSEVTP